MTTTVTYTYNAGAALALPGGIFTKPAEFQIDVTSASIADTGTYVITMIISDTFPASFTSTFTLSITNAIPRVATVPGAVSLVHGSSLSIPLTSNFVDDDGDPLTMAATYSLSGGAAVTLPSGIFTVPSAFTIYVASTSIADTGVYTMSLTVSDPLPASVTQTFTVTVTNAAPRLLSAPPSPSIVHGNTISMPLSAYFVDDDADPLTMTATYSLNGGAAIAIPGGIFTVSSLLTIVATSTGLVDVGAYTISLSISDSLSAVTTSYTLSITNASPRLVSAPLAVTAP
jgi:hypothetical protein